MQVPVTVYGDVDPRAVEQIERCASEGHALRAVLCADAHVGYSQPIGGAVAYPDHISPSGVGYDIACGNKAARTPLRADDLRPDLDAVMDAIYDRVSFGVGRKNNEPADSPVLDAIREADFPPQRQLYDLAAAQLGTVGSGNHYVDLLEDDDGYVWVGVHFGSRGFGHKTASGFLALARGLPFEGKAPEGEMDSAPVLFRVDAAVGQAYIAAMGLAGQYAYAGRDAVVAKVLEILGTTSNYEVHNHHNFAWRERHFDEDVWVVRKGCTPAFPGQEGFVGATMGEPSVVLRGVEAPASADLLYSTVHGAGRVMSRTQAAGKWRKRWVNNVRDDEDGYATREEALAFPGAATARRVRFRGEGRIDWPAALAELDASGVVLRGGGPDEAPGAYKRLGEVLAAHEGTIEVTHTLRPLGVAMAGADVHDPYKE